MSKLRILMLGNSFIFVNDLPSILADLTGAEVVHHTRGGARLAEQLNPATKMGGLTQAALQNEKWDLAQQAGDCPGPGNHRYFGRR